MRRDVVPWLKVAVCGVVACGYLALLATLMYPAVLLGIVVGAIAFMPIGERLQRETDWYTQVTGAIAILALFGLFASAPGLGPLNTVIGLMMLVQVHAMVHVKRQRHYGYLMLMAFSEVMAASMMSPAPEIGLVYILLVVFTIWTLVLLDIFRSTEEQGEVHLRGSLDFEARNGAVRESGGRAFRRTMIGWISGLAVSSIVLSAGLFFVIPRTEAGAFGAQDVFPVQEEYTTGLSSRIDLLSRGRITEDRTALMDVRFSELPQGRFNGAMYWRVTTFLKYDGAGWSREGLTTESVRLFQRSARFAVRPDGPRGSEEGVYRADYSAKNTVSFDIFLTELPTEGIPLLSLPLMVQPQTKEAGLWGWDMAGDFTVHHAHRGESGIAYRGVSVVDEFTPEQLRSSREDYSQIVNAHDMKLLTEHNLLPETVGLVEEITADSESMYDKLLAIQQFLSTEEFQYSLEIPELPEKNPVDAFVMTVRSGHCQLFAAAMALMARSQGVPARLVSGYRGGTYDESAGTYTVSANMAHVWVEAFFPDFGWIIFDPSPPAEDLPVFSFETIRSTYSATALKLKLFWLRNIVGYNAEERATSLGSQAEDARVAAPEGAAAEPRRVQIIQTVADNLPSLVFGFIGVTAAVSGALALRSALLARRRLAGLDVGQVRAVKLYRLLRRRLTRLGLDCTGRTAEELRSVAAEMHGQLGNGVAMIVETYNAVRFGARPLPAGEFKRLKRQLHSLSLKAR